MENECLCICQLSTYRSSPMLNAISNVRQSDTCSSKEEAEGASPYRIHSIFYKEKAVEEEELEGIGV